MQLQGVNPKPEKWTLDASPLDTLHKDEAAQLGKALEVLWKTNPDTEAFTRGIRPAVEAAIAGRPALPYHQGLKVLLNSPPTPWQIRYSVSRTLRSTPVGTPGLEEKLRTVERIIERVKPLPLWSDLENQDYWDDVVREILEKPDPAVQRQTEPRSKSGGNDPQETGKGQESAPRSGPTPLVANLGQFVGAYLLKEGVKALESGDLQEMKRAWGQVGTGGFWASLGIFSATAHATDALVAMSPGPVWVRTLGRTVLPLAIGTVALQGAAELWSRVKTGQSTGQFTWRNVLVSTGSFLLAGSAVSIVDALVYPVLFATPPGWLAALTYGAVKLGVTLYAGEKVEAWFHGLLDDSSGNRNPVTPSRSPSTRGVRRKLDSLSNP
jgi:hypothetical protein